MACYYTNNKNSRAARIVSNAKNRGTEALSGVNLFAEAKTCHRDFTRCSYAWDTLWKMYWWRHIDSIGTVHLPRSWFSQFYFLNGISILCISMGFPTSACQEEIVPRSSTSSKTLIISDRFNTLYSIEESSLGDHAEIIDGEGWPYSQTKEVGDYSYRVHTPCSPPTPPPPPPHRKWRLHSYKCHPKGVDHCPVTKTGASWIGLQMYGQWLTGYQLESQQCTESPQSAPPSHRRLRDHHLGVQLPVRHPRWVFPNPPWRELQLGSHGKPGLQ